MLSFLGQCPFELRFWEMHIQRGVSAVRCVWKILLSLRVAVHSQVLKALNIYMQ